jgi:tRNA pseudouridine55 synthase
MDGVLVIDKPAGPTSHDIVSKVRHALREKKVGHTGTLDPAATGVLPLVLGRATKLAQYLSGGDKTYRAVIRLGVCTTTLDAEGEVTQTRDVTCSEAEVRAAAAAMVGQGEQVPPMYSAKKIDGKKLYELARKGIEVERPAKPITIHFINILNCTLPDIELDVKCSAGTYVRVLAQDLGEKLGCGGHLLSLRRVAAGPFNAEDAVTLEALIADPSLAERHLLPMHRALEALKRIDVPADIARMIGSGYQLTVADLRNLDIPVFAVGDAIAIAVDGGDLIAVARAEIASNELEKSRRERRALQTERVLNSRD